jgi:hypothetical protein
LATGNCKYHSRDYSATFNFLLTLIVTHSCHRGRQGSCY